jgi:hypothetical protein
MTALIFFTCNVQFHGLLHKKICHTKVWIYQQNIQLVFYIMLAFIIVNLLAGQYDKGNPTLGTLLQLPNTM